jgi:hypothetical protein|tara:strand:- start:184 stop:801 length:618 start_codon:yes stop_codon:yes gene_type:complete
MGVISNGTTLLDAGALDSGVATGAMTLIKTLTASSSGTLSFVHGTSSVVLDGTYKEYVFKFIDIHGETNSKEITFQGSTNSGSSYGLTITSSAYVAYHNEAGNSAVLEYGSNSDQAQATGFQMISGNAGNGNDESISGTLHLFDPSNTTFVKHFIARSNCYNANDYSQDFYAAGYFNTTSAIDAIQFKMVSGNIDAGTIKLYGIK